MRSIALVGLILVLAMGGLFYWKNASSSALDPSRVSAERNGAPSVVDEGQDQPRTRSQASAEPSAGRGAGAQAAREELESLGLRGRVVDPSGTGIEGVELNWIAPRSQDLRWEAGWQVDDWGALERSEALCRSDATGQFHFEATPAMEGVIGSAIWATKAGFEARCHVLAPAELGSPRIVLQAAAAILVHVEDVFGNPVAGALVEQFGLTPTLAPVGVGGTLDAKRMRRLLRRSGRTLADGSLSLGALPGEQVFRARTATGQSVAWRGLAPQNLVLRLESSFQVSGTIELPDWSHLNYDGERRLLIGIQAGTLWKGLASLRAVGEGAWGPVSLPLLLGQTYSVKLEGSPIIPITRYFQAPAPGEVVQLHFRPELGSSVLIAGLDEQGEPVLGVTATVWWEENGIRQTITRRASPGADTANPWSMPPCELFYSVSAPGYAPGVGFPFRLPEAEMVVHAVDLLKAGGLRGRVTHQGQPVEDFDLHLWKRFTYSNDQTISFRGRTDGRFEIDTAPLGEMAVSASAAGLPPVRNQLVTIPGEGSAEVLIELQAAARGVGRVLDLETGAAIGDARLMVISNLEGRRDAPLGLPQHVRSDGHFRLEGLPSGKNYIQVSAPGYAPLVITPVGIPGEDVDCGDVALARPRSLELRLVSDDDSLDFSEYSASISFPGLLPMTPFPAGGTLICDGAPPGNYVVSIWKGANQQASVSTSFFPGEAWVLEHRVGDGKTVLGKLLASATVGRNMVTRVNLIYSDRVGFKSTLPGSLDEEGNFRFEHVPGPTALVSALDENGFGLGRAGGAFGEAESLELELRLGAGALKLRIKDKAGAPIEAAWLRMRERGGKPYFNYGGTDAAGLLKTFGIPERPIEVFVSHPEHGLGVFAIEGGLQGAGEVNFALTNDAGMRVRLMDGDFPLLGAHAAIADAQQQRVFGYTPAGSDGIVPMQGFSPGSYRLIATHAHCWPVIFDAVASAEEPLVEVQLRRLGHLELSLQDAAGQALAGVRLELMGDWEGGDVRAWVEQGRVQASSEVSDERGMLLLHGLPRGEYRWSALDQSGILKVKPLETTKLSLVLGG